MRRRREGIVRPVIGAFVSGVGVTLFLVGATLVWLRDLRNGVRAYREVYRR